MERLRENAHAQDLFNKLFVNEQQHCGEFVVFYHSYSWAAVLYELRAAIAKAVFGFHAEDAPLPRLGERDFQKTPSAQALMRRVQTEWGSEKIDHKPEFRQVGISAMCSAVATGPECCLQVAFNQGYSCKSLNFRGLLEDLLQQCALEQEHAKSLTDDVVELSGRYGLDTSRFGGSSGELESRGHILQIFVHRALVDRLCYPAKPYGEVDEERLPLSKWLAEDRDFSWGQVRILAHPRYFMRLASVRMFVISANQAFHEGRKQFQVELAQLLSRSLGKSECRKKASRALDGRSK